MYSKDKKVVFSLRFSQPDFDFLEFKYLDFIAKSASHLSFSEFLRRTLLNSLNSNYVDKCSSE